MRYTITITKDDYEQSIIGKRWEVVSQDGDGKHVWGYTPETTATREVHHKVYEQTVDELDMAAVIIAVNGLVNISREGVAP